MCAQADFYIRFQAGIIPNNALELITGKELECEMGTWRLIGMYEKGMSTVIPELPVYWRLETKHVDTKYSTFEKEAMKDTWTRDIDFILEPRLFEDFSPKVSFKILIFP